MKSSFYLFLCVIGYLAYGIVIVLLTKAYGNIIFVWNVFLAFLPFLFAQMLRTYLKRDVKKKSIVILLALLWLVFFPNSPYMITDLIHYNSASSVTTGNFHTTLYWFKLLYIGSGMVFAALMGLSSLYDMHAMIQRWKGRGFGIGFIVIVSWLGGFALYVGRILRFNSWDILRPFSLVSTIINELSTFSVSLSFLFAVYILATYIVYYIVAHKEHPAAIPTQP